MRIRLALAGIVALAACTSPAAGGEAIYILAEGVIDGPSQMKSSGSTTIEANNVGDYAHTLVVADDRGEVLAATGLIQPGGDATLEVDLEPGTYVFSCRIVAQDDAGNLMDHYELGMHRTITVTG
jgi:uncharacterized cupredoxin-like copper-binding protein